MILTYIRRNFRRRKVRTVLMVLALIVGVGTLVTLNATVDSYRRFFAGTVSGEVGDFDLVITRPDTARSPFLDAGALIEPIAAVPGVRVASPRIHGIVALAAGDERGDAAMVALDPARDAHGSVEVTDGAYDLGVRDGLPGALVLQQTADVLGLAVGDPVEVQYAAPVGRLPGRPAEGGGSRRRTTATWVVRGIGTQRGVTGQADNQGILLGLDAARERFGLGGLAERIVVDFEPALYDARDPQRSAFRAREITEAVRDALGAEDVDYRMPRPRAVIDGANAFIFSTALITMYGLLSLSVVGMLIRTLIMTNVQEQTRDMALLRILGAPRRRLFDLVAAEVAAIGVLGVGLGIVVGQLINNLVIVPFIAGRAGDLLAEVPLVSVSSVLLAVLTSGIVLAVSTFAPARRAAGTKVTHVINPGVADGIGLDDLAKMRERRTDLRVSGAGLVVLTYPLLIFFVIPLAFDFGVLSVLAALIFGALLALIVGAALLVFIVILPFEKLLVGVMSRFAPRTGYFVRRTLLRGKVRNTLIALMIVMSATLPTFLSTSLALEVANSDTDRRLNGGAAFRITPPTALEGATTGPPRTRRTGLFAPELLGELRADPGFAATAGLSEPFATRLDDGVGLRDARVRVTGVDADLRGVLYPEAIELVAGEAGAFRRILDEPDVAIVGVGLATYFDVGVGDVVELEGGGRDHTVPMTVVGIARRIGGTGTYTAKQTAVWSGDSTVLVGMATYHRLVSDPLLGPPDPAQRLVRSLLAAPAAGIDEAELTGDLRLRYATEHDLFVDSTAETIATIRQESRTGQLFLVVLTALTSILAIFGVFAVIYVSIYGRRGEIGMMKAMGSPKGHLLRVFVGEALIMTLSATLTGVAAGVTLGYALRLSEGFRNEVPTRFALDPIVVPAMLILMILSSLIAATAATHGYRKRSALDVLRTV